MSNTARRKVCVVLVDRANYGRLKPVMRAIDDNPALQLQVLAAGTMVLERFDQPVRVVKEDNFTVDGEVYIELEGSTPATMAKSVGFAMMEFASEFQRLKPDVILLIGDRYEALAAAVAAAYMNICIVHVQGGEVSGSIDESARHAITKFAHYHFPSTKRSGEYLVRMGERPGTILGIGCPSSDIARTFDRTLHSHVVNTRGSGAVIDLASPFLLVLFHPAQHADDPALAQYRRRVRPCYQGDPRFPRSGETGLAANVDQPVARELSEDSCRGGLCCWQFEQFRPGRRLLRHSGSPGRQPAGRTRNRRPRETRPAPLWSRAAGRSCNGQPR